MLPYTQYRKFVLLTDGRQVLLRLLFRHDQDGLLQMFHAASEAEVRYLKWPVKDPRLMQAWLEGLNYRTVLPLVAVDLMAHRFVGVALLTRERLGAGGQVHLFAAEPFRRLGLVGALLEELLDLAGQEDLQWLTARVAAADRLAVRAFRDRGFEIRATLEDLFLSVNGSSRPVLLMTRPVMGKTPGAPGDLNPKPRETKI